MSRRRWIRETLAVLLCGPTFWAGCTPTQPYYFHEDGDLSHYANVATEIEYPELQQCPNPEVENSQTPLTIANADSYQHWDMTLEEATRLALSRSQVIRQLGGRISDQGANIAQAVPEVPGAAGAVTSTYDPALTESGYGGNTGNANSGTGVEAALAEFDAQLNSSITWNKNDRPQNFGGFVGGTIFAPRFQQDTSQFNVGLTKVAATGSTFALRNNINYDQNNNGSRIATSDWVANIEASFSQPLLQGGGVQYNRIAGPRSFGEFDAGFADQFDGVMIARIRQDISLADFENGVRQLMFEVEEAYWELHYSYRDLEARKSGRDSALATWQRVKELERVGSEGGEADKEAQARTQYYLFRAQVETALTTVFRQENKVRYLLGLPSSDGRLIRPIDEPTAAPVTFDWTTVHVEALARRVELRKQRWQVKRRELELIAARNGLLPRLDAVGTYRWLGAGDDLLNSSRTGIDPFFDGSNAFESLTSGDFQEWQIGVQFSLPIGFRRAMATVRHHQLLLAHERALLKEAELAVSYQLSDAFRDVEHNFAVAQTYFNRRAASQDQVEAIEAIYDVGKTTLDQLLDAQRIRAEADSAYYRSLVDYNRAIMRLHWRKGSLLEYNGVYLAEGPWPGKAYFDALRRARQRDASLMLDYGYTRPEVVSRGQVAQYAGSTTGGPFAGSVQGRAESLPTPSEAAPLDALPTPGVEASPAPAIDPLPPIEGLFPDSSQNRETYPAFDAAAAGPAVTSASAVAVESSPDIADGATSSTGNPFSRFAAIPAAPPTPLAPSSHEAAAPDPPLEAAATAPSGAR